MFKWMISSLVALMIINIIIIADVQSMSNSTTESGVSPSVNTTIKNKSLEILGLDPTAFPKIRISIFINKFCAQGGALKKEDFKINEDGHDIAIDNLYFTGNASGHKLDLAIVFDDTGSMQPEIAAMKSKVKDLTDKISASGIDANYSLVSFKDSVSVKTRWTNDSTIFEKYVDALYQYGGGDEPEDSLDAIESVLSMGFRPDAQKVILVITDAHAHYKNDGSGFSKYSQEDVEKDLKDRGVIFMPISPTFKEKTGYVDLRKIANDIQSIWVDMGSADFSIILEQFKGIITGNYVIEYTSPNQTAFENRTALIAADIPGCIIESSSISYNSLSVYRNTDLSLEYPKEWTVSAFGERSAGNISILSRDTFIFLTWTRDPGVEPERILDQVRKVYSGGEIGILSSAHSQMRLRGENASVLDLYYSLGKYGARKRFAVWNSSVSDRLFFATLSSRNESYNLSTLAFDHLLETFSDMPHRKATKLEQRTAKGDAWSIVLGDLLSSYSYKDTSALLSRKVHLETIHSLVPLNGAYQLSSKDEINVDLPLAAAVRASAVQDLLNKYGYKTMLLQRGGNIWVVVQDPLGSWQLVSLNPREPERMIGVPIDTGDEGIVYRNISELTEDNLMRFDFGIDNSSKIIHKDCEPSKYVELRRPSSENKSWLEDLQKFLESYDYSQSFRENVFDCSNTSQICWSILQGKGYDARIMISYNGHPLDSYMWVVVRYPYEAESYVAIDATITDKNEKLIHLGRITMKDDHYKGIMYNTSAQFSWLHPEEGMWRAGG